MRDAIFQYRLLYINRMYDCDFFQAWLRSYQLIIQHILLLSYKIDPIVVSWVILQEDNRDHDYIYLSIHIHASTKGHSLLLHHFPSC